MESFTLDWGRSWFARLFGRNHLVRPSDRLESLVTTLALIAVVMAVPLVAALGTSIKEARSSTYAREALGRHQLTATAIANGTATVHTPAYVPPFGFRARWDTAGSVHVATVFAPHMINTGDQLEIWVDTNGNYAQPPIPPSKAATEAVGWAVLAWMAVAGALGAGVYGLHRRLNRTRYSQWDLELDALAGNDGGRASH